MLAAAAKLCFAATDLSRRRIKCARTRLGAEGSPSREPWDAGRALRTAAYFGALPNPLQLFSSRGGAPLTLARGDKLFSREENPLQLEWGNLDDVVMGGASCSAIEGSTWKGTIITEGGGFAGIRTKALEPALDASRCTGIRLRVKGGQGQRFKLIIRDDYDWNGIAWSYSFDTQTLLPGSVEVSAPFESFVPTKFARRVANVQFNRKQLTTLQITLSKFEYDGGLNPSFQAGDFELDLESIETY